MKKHTRIFIMGHPGAGKALLAQTLAIKLGWEFIDAELGLEYRIGRTVNEIMGSTGVGSFFNCQHETLASLLKKDNIVVATDASFIMSTEISKLLAQEYLVYLYVSLPIQVERLSRSTKPLLLSAKEKEIQNFLKVLHNQRDTLYKNLATLTINSDDNDIDRHILTIQESIGYQKLSKQNAQLNLEKKDLILFHKTLHIPIPLTKQQAKCVKLLAQGRASKDIAKELKISYRTVEGILAKVMENLGCHTSKELVVLYHS